MEACLHNPDGAGHHGLDRIWHAVLRPKSTAGIPFHWGEKRGWTRFWWRRGSERGPRLRVFFFSPAMTISVPLILVYRLPREWSALS